MSATTAKLGIRKQPVCFGTRLAKVLVSACIYAIVYRASIHRHPQYRLCLPLAFPRYNRSTSLRRRGPFSSAPFFLALICCLSVFTVVSLRAFQDKGSDIYLEIPRKPSQLISLSRTAWWTGRTPTWSRTCSFCTSRSRSSCSASTGEFSCCPHSPRPLHLNRDYARS